MNTRLSKISRRLLVKLVPLGLLNITSLSSKFVLADPNDNQQIDIIPMIGRPTGQSITINLFAIRQDVLCRIEYKKKNESILKWKKTKEIKIKANDTKNILLSSLSTDETYVYKVYARLNSKSSFQMVHNGAFATQALQASGFSFAIVSDSHITIDEQVRLEILSQTCLDIAQGNSEFLMMLGDNIQTFTSHGGPITDPVQGTYLYMKFRYGLRFASPSRPIFLAIGNWEGENGWHSTREIGWARQARKKFIPNPNHLTYPQKGSVDEDYYGFTWKGVLFLVLNSTGYTLSNHDLGSPVGKEDDWTLGKEQKEWLHRQLSQSKEKWKLMFIHHPAGGAGPSAINARYGRGGGLAAKIGEQKLIHEWMMQFGVQAMFYGHDHVFTDLAVDGIHYICAGSAGAPWKFETSETGYKTYFAPSGYTKVDVMEHALKVSFIQSYPEEKRGQVLHSFKISQHSNT